MNEDYDDWVERLDPHARDKVQQMFDRNTDLTDSWRSERDRADRAEAVLREIAEGCGHTRCHAYPWIRMARKALG